MVAFFIRFGLCIGLLVSAYATAECSRLKVSGTAEYPPYLWQLAQPGAALDGAIVDMLAYISQHTQVQFQLEDISAWARTQKELEEQQLDMLAGIFYNDHRAKFMDYIQPPLTISNTRIWVHPDFQQNITALEQLQGLQGATVIGFSLGKTFDNYAAQHLQLHRLRSITQGFKMLADRRIDYIAYEEQPGQAILSTMDIPALTMLPMEVSAEGVFLGLAKASPCNTPELKEQLSRAITQAIADKKMDLFIQQAHRKWQSLKH